MKTLISAVVFAIISAFSLNSFAGQQCSDHDHIFYGQTKNHKKEVEVCEINGKYTYRFGKIEQTPELSFSVPMSAAEVMNSETQFEVIRTITMVNGNTNYIVSYVDGGNNPPMNILTVTQGDKLLAQMVLDPDTVSSNIEFIK